MATLDGGVGADTLVDTSDGDSLSGLAGNDTISVSAGADTVNGGADADRLVVNYAGAPDPIRNVGDTGFASTGGTALPSVTFTGVESFDITTGGGADTIRSYVREDATNNANATVLSGNDVIRTGAGADLAAGGEGNDSLFGGTGDDTLDGDGNLSGKFGGGGNLAFIEFMGNDALFGEEGNDRLYGGNGSDILDGGIGDDLLIGDRIVFQATGTGVRVQENVGSDMLSGADTLIGGEGNDTIDGNAGNDSISGGVGDDLARVTVTSEGADNVDLGAGNDVVQVTANADSQVSSAIRLTFTSAEIGNGNPLDGGTMAGQDGGLAVRLQSENYVDGLVGPVSRYDDEGITFVGQGAVTFDVRDLVSGVQRGNQFQVVTLGTSGADVQTAVLPGLAYYFNAGAGNDLVTGGTANDFLVGGGGNDTLDGAAGADSFLGGGGNDALIGGIGDDNLDGGDGDDAFSGGVGSDTIRGGAGNDILAVSTLEAGADNVDLGEGTDTVLVTGAPGQIRLSFTSAEVGNGLATDAGTMANQDGGLALRFQSENGADALVGPISRYDDEGITFIAGTAGITFDVRDLVAGTQRGNQFIGVTLGTSGDDVMTVLPGRINDAFYYNAGGGNDRIDAGNANDFLVGGGGADTLNAGGGNDNLLGGAGDDRLTGGVGSDQIDGGAGIDTAVFAGSLASYTATDLGQRVTVTRSDGADVLLGVEVLVFDNLTITLNDGDPLFDALFYFQQNPDVLAAGLDAKEHYNAFGFREGRDPNAFFDSSGYLAANRDVAAAGLNPLEHYRTLGAAEGRDASLDFDTALYRFFNPDVAATTVNPLEHFLTFGRAEGRASYTAIGNVTPDGFDSQFYLLSNPDVAAAGVDARTHYATVGKNEGRDPNVLFDTSYYLLMNPDVAAAGVDPLAHYSRSGFREGRDPSAAFDTSAYLAVNTDIGAAGINPLAHFLQIGVFEGRMIADPNALIA